MEFDYSSQTSLHARTPADNLSEAYLLGNGKMGVIFGGSYVEERLMFSHEAIWSGALRDRVNSDAFAGLQAAKEFFEKGEYGEAKARMSEALSSSPSSPQSLLKAGELSVKFVDLVYGDENEKKAKILRYARCLDFEIGVASCEFAIGDASYKVEVFVSRSDDTIVYHIECDKARSINVNCRLSRENHDEPSKKYGENRIIMQSGGNSMQASQGQSVPFCALLQAECKGAKADVSVIGDTLRVRGADELDIYLSCEAGFSKRNMIGKCVNVMESVLSQKSYRVRRNRHVQEHSNLFGRCRVFCGEVDVKGEKKKRYGKARAKWLLAQKSSQLLGIALNKARYLLLASASGGLIPPCASGIWPQLNAGNFAKNRIDNFFGLQAIFSAAEPLGLSEAHESIFEHLEKMRQSGKVCARRIFGKDGTIFFGQSDIWGDAAPSGDEPDFWLAGAAWLCSRVWEKFRYNEDISWLRLRGYPILRSVADFYYSILGEKGDQNCLSTAPKFVRRTGDLSLFPTGFERKILKDFFSICVRCAELLDIDEAKVANWCACADSLCANVEVEETSLFSLYELLPATDGAKDGARVRREPEYYAQIIADLFAKKETFSIAESSWLAAVLARLNESESAFKLLTQRVLPSYSSSFLSREKGVDAFDLSGNLAFASVFLEFIVRYDDEGLRVLPALPKQMPNGRIEGLRLPGKIVISMSWENGRLAELALTSSKESVLSVSWKNLKRTISLQALEVTRLDGELKPMDEKKEKKEVFQPMPTLSERPLIL